METKASPRGFWRMTAVLIGLVMLAAAYYRVHPLIDTVLAARFIAALADVLTVFALFAAAGGIGRALLSRVDLASLMRAEQLALETLVGLGVVSIAAMLLGLAGVFRGVVFWPALLVAALLLRRSVVGWLRDVLAARELIAGLRLQSGWTRLIAGITLVLLALALLRALAPPFTWDAMTYHLVAPARYLAAERIAAYPDNHFLGFPQLIEVLFGVAMSAFGHDTTAGLVHFGFGLLGLMAVGGLAARYTNRAVGWLTVTLFASAFSAWMLLGSPYIDLALFAYGAAALVAVNRWRETDADSWLMAAGAAAGFALSVKYTAVGLALAVAIAIVLHAPRRAIRNGLLAVGIAMVVFAPWMLKGALLYGNPVYPFFFGGLNWDALRAETFSTFGNGLLSSGRLWQLPVLPVAATIYGVEKGPQFGFTAGLWLLTAPLLLIAGWRWLSDGERRLACDCALLGVPLLLFWMALAAVSNLGDQTRLMLAALAPASVAGAVGIYGLARWPKRPLQPSGVLRAVFALTFVLGALDAARQTLYEQTLPYLFGLTERAAFLDSNLGAYANALRHLETLPPGSEVRFLWEPRSYGCPAGIVCHPDILFDYWGHPLKNGQTPEAVLNSWRAAGNDYALFWHTGYEDWLSEPRFATENALFPDAVEQFMVPVWTDGIRYTLYGWPEAAGL